MKGLQRLVVLWFAYALCAPIAEAQGTLTVTGLDGASEVVTAESWSALPRTRVQAVGHDGRTATFEGVAASVLLQRAHAPLGSALRGKNLAVYVVADAADGYRAAYALAEFDAAFSDRIILIADLRDGEALDLTEGPLQLVVPGEKRQARWVRQLTRLSVKRAE